MKTLRFPVILVLVLALAAFFAGTLVGASAAPANGTRLAGAPALPAITDAEWAAISGANALLLDDESPEMVYLPLIVGQ